MKEAGNRIELNLYEGAEHRFFNKSPYFEDTLYKTDVFLTSLGYLKGKPTIKKPMI
jgi:hypothetical protein